MLRRLLAVAAAGLAVLIQALPVSACGGLVAANGAVRLARATTLVEWHAGVEHYLTSFTYQGVATGLGWIVPLPAVPTSVLPGGRWTLQRLERETNPQPLFALHAPGALAASADRGVEILQKTQVDALDITVIRGSGQAVLDWCRSNDFLLNAETRGHILEYAQASPIFMAARYDVGAALARGQISGDGTPVLITMPTPHLWVPLEVLANANDPLQADLYLLTDHPLQHPNGEFLGAPGFRVAFEEGMNPVLLHDLSTDRNMQWVPAGSWLTYLTLRTTGRTVTYDLAVGSDDGIRLAGYATAPATVATTPRLVIGLPSRDTLSGATALASAILAGTALLLWARRRSAASG